MAHDLDLDLRAADAHVRLLEKVRALTADLDTALAERSASVAIDGDVATRGYATLASIAEASTCERLGAVVDRLLDAGLPAVFLFVTDLALGLGQRLEQSVSGLLGAPYVLVDDLWAWRIPRGSSGWPAHRGVTTRLDRALPELVNTWVALSPVEANRSCMHFVPLDDDPNYPNGLERIDFVPEAVRPLPLAAGQALVWNANILHWGGRCAPEAAGPRVSCSLSLERADDGVQRASLYHLAPQARVDLIAAQIATYGHGQPDVTPSLLAWARASCALRAHLAARP